VSVQQLDIPDDLQEALGGAIAHIAEAASPQAIVLFGSYGEGSARSDSDLDLLVVARTNNRWRLAARLYLLWNKLRHASPALPRANILVYTPRQFVEQLEVGFPAYRAARHGVTLYGQLPQRRAQVADQGRPGSCRC